MSKRHDSSEFATQIFIDDLHAVIEYYKSNDLQQVVLIRSVLEAMLATAYVNQFPDDILGLVLKEPGGFTWGGTKEYISRSQFLEVFSESISRF
ncbi:hypothetical protein [Flavivirga sp. 57AJ16]|uniref:hypothetical protein n=1 Tax=Flavivirga sp. 57AJ16 TaxID=3025307 RepID=UPI002367224D|nr:hypothetical protein [Flavivirga sp. 57AJ16]MDD7885472.1 hypothetical protein [Flavivirga sp. 57AJ16]